MLGRNALNRFAAVVAIVFGVLTIVSGGRALFGAPEARAAVGDAVPFVLWFNFVAGFFYVLAGLGLLARRHWSVGVSVGILIATLGILALFGIHVWRGGAYETRTVFAMIVRVVVWLGISAVAMQGRPAQADPPAKRRA